MGPQEVEELLTENLEKFNDRALLQIERHSGDVFFGRISGETRSDMESKCTLGLWKY